MKLVKRPGRTVTARPTSHCGNSLAKFGKTLASIPALIAAHRVTGDCGYLLRVVVKDTHNDERLLRETLHKIKGIRAARALRCAR